MVESKMSDSGQYIRRLRKGRMKLIQAITEVEGNRDWWHIWNITEPTWFSCCAYLERKMSSDKRDKVYQMKPEDLEESLRKYHNIMNLNKKNAERSTRIHIEQNGYCYGSRCRCVVR